MKKILYVLAILAMLVPVMAAADCIPSTPPGDPVPAYQPCDENLIVNGDFEETDGASLGFTSDYDPYFGFSPGDVSFSVPGVCYQDQGGCGNDTFDPSMWCEGVWVIGQNPANYHFLWYYTTGGGAYPDGVGNFGDHTTNRGNMLILNGSTTANTVVWRQTVTGIIHNTPYTFSFWARSAYTTAPPVLDVEADGVKLSLVPFTPTPGLWQQVSYQWVSGTASEVTFEISNQEAAPSGNDYALDDIELCLSGDEYSLCAGQTMVVGGVNVWNDDTTLYVTYLITEPGVCLSETHLHVAGPVPPDDPIPQTKKGNPIPGKFDYQTEHNCATSYTYQIPLTWVDSTPLDIAAHAVVQTPSSGTARTCADGVFEYLQGTLKSGESVSLERSYPTKTFGEPDSDSAVNFYSLGFDNLTTEPVEGTLTLSFPTFISGDLSVYEVTWGGYCVEQAEVYVSRDGADWTYIGIADNTSSTANVRESILSIGGCVQYVKLVDATDRGSCPSNADAFDVDAVCASSTCDEETAWVCIEDGYDFPGSNWAAYFTYAVE